MGLASTAFALQLSCFPQRSGRWGSGAPPAHGPQPAPRSRPPPQHHGNLLYFRMVKETNREPPHPRRLPIAGSRQPRLVCWDAGGLHYSSPWNIQAVGQSLNLSGLAALLPPRGPRGLGKLQGSGAETSSWPDPGRGARCLCHLTDVLIWGECIIEHRALSSQTPGPNGAAVSPWWEPQRTHPQGELVAVPDQWGPGRQRLLAQFLHGVTSSKKTRHSGQISCL